MKMLLAALVPVLAFMPNDASAFVQTKFASEDAARLRCPADPIVWQMIPGNLFVPKGDPRYGATQRGAYMCERDAVADGNRRAH